MYYYNYDMRLYFILLIILISSLNPSAAVAFSPNDIEWTSAVSGTLHQGETLENGRFMVKATQFPSPVPGEEDINGNIIVESEVDPMVYVEIYKDGAFVLETIMYPGSDTYVDPEYEGRIYPTGFMTSTAQEWIYEFYNPWATVGIELRAKPKIEVSVTTDKTTYTSYEDNIITATVTVTNTGEAFLKNVDVNLDLGELKLRGGGTDQLHQYYSRLEKGASQTFSVILVVPKLLDAKSYSLSTDAKGYDVKELEYTATGSTSATVEPKQNYFTISKSVSKDRIYLTDTILAKIVVANGGIYDIHDITINDTMAGDFELKSNTSFQYHIPLLEPNREWSHTYSIKPLEANLNGFSIPSASAKFTVNNRQYSEDSGTISVVVNGPKIVLEKTVDKPTVNIDEDVTVTVTIKNEGNIGTKAEVKDLLPDGVSLVSGSTSLESTFLEADDPKGFSYIIRMNKEGNISLPPAVANYTGIEYKGITRSSISSNSTIVTVIDPSRIPPTPTTTQSSSDTTSGSNTGSNQDTSQQGTSDSPQGAPTPEPTLITPGFSLMSSIIAVFITFARRAG